MQKQSIPMLFVHGSHYDVGYRMGKTFSAQVKHYYDTSNDWLVKFEEFNKTPEGAEFCDRMWTSCEKRFPHYIDELRGISDGSGIPFNKIKFQHMERELATKLALFKDIFDDAPMGCTDVMINSTEERIIGHNEDWIPSMNEYDLILCATITEYTASDGRVFPEESFVVHTWPGLLMGMNSGFNKHGLVFSIDHIYPDNVQPKTLELFLCRHMLTAKSTEEALSILEDSGFGTSLGYTVNLGSTGSDILYNVELSMDPNNDSSSLSVVEINPTPPDELGYGRGVCAHYNNFARIGVESQCLKHCLGRKERIESELSPPHDFKSLVAVIGDEDSREPANRVFMDPDAGYNWGTVASVVYDIKRETMSVFKSSPKTSNPVAVIPFGIIG